MPCGSGDMVLVIEEQDSVLMGLDPLLLFIFKAHCVKD